MKSLILFQYAEFFAHLDEGGNATVEMFAVVSGRNLYADARLILRHDGVVETGHIDSLVLETSRVVLREFGVIEHNGANGALGRFDVEAGFHHLRAEIFHVLHEAVVNFVAFIENLEHFDASAHH